MNFLKIKENNDPIEPVVGGIYKVYMLGISHEKHEYIGDFWVHGIHRAREGTLYDCIGTLWDNNDAEYFSIFSEDLIGFKEIKGN